MVNKIDPSEVEQGKPMRASEPKEKIIDRDILFMKRLQDEGANIHLNNEDRRMIQAFTSESNSSVDFVSFIDAIR